MNAPFRLASTDSNRRDRPEGSRHPESAPRRVGTISSATTDALERVHFSRDLADRLLGVAEQQLRLRIVEERIVDAREPGGHRALEHDHRLRLVDLEDR